MNKTQIINQESSTASDFEFPCKPLLGPSPKLMQPQPSPRVVQGSIVWRQHMGGAHWGAKIGGVWGGEAFLRPFLHWQCQLGTVPYFTVITVKYGVTITVVRRSLSSLVRTVQTVIVPYHTTRQA